jgi:EAL domain-containing protein (putative c-di-GMP-specific phosphodiesterase class I)
MQGYLFGRPVPVESFEQNYMLLSRSASLVTETP